MRTVTWVVTGAVLLFCVVAFRLLLMPINLDFAREQVLSAASEALPNWQVDYSSAAIGWNWRQVQPWVSVTDLVLISPDTTVMADIPRTEITVGWLSLLASPQITTLQVENGRLIVNLPTSDKDEPAAEAPPPPSDSAQTVSAAALSQSLGSLRAEDLRPAAERIAQATQSIRRAFPRLTDVSLEDLQVFASGTGVSKELSLFAPAITFQQGDTGASLNARVDIPLGGEPIGMTLTVDTDEQTARSDVAIAVHNVKPQALASDMTLPTFAKWIDIPVAAELAVTLSSTAGLEAAAATIRLQRGRLYDPSAYPSAAPILDGVIRAAFDPETHRVDVSEVHVALPNADVRGQGMVQFTGQGALPVGDLQLSIKQAQVRTVLDYWPIARHPDGSPKGGRAWVDRHMIGAIASNAVFDVKWDETGVGPFYEGSPFRLSFDFRDLESYAVSTMPPVKYARGSASVTMSRLEADVEEAFLNGVRLSETHILLADIEKKGKNKGFFDLRLRGDVKKVMDVLDHRPVRLGERTKISLDRVDGFADVRARIFVALKDQINEEDLYYHAEGKIEDGVLRDVLSGEGVSKAALNLSVDQSQLRMWGDMHLNGVPIYADWREDLDRNRDDQKALSATTFVKATVPAEQLENLGVASSRYLTGPVSAEAVFRGRGLVFTQAHFTLDGKDATLRVPELSWVRGPGTPLAISGDTHFGDGTIRISPLELRGEGVDADIRVQLTPGQARSGLQMTANVRQLGAHNLSARLAQDDDGGFDIWIDALQFDARPLLNSVSGADAEDITETRRDIATVEEVEAALAPPEEEPPVRVHLDAEKLLLLNGESVNSLSMTAQFISGEPVYVGMKGTIVDGERSDPVSLIIGAETIDYSSQVLRPIEMQTSNGGALLRGLGYFAHLQGGDFTLEGQTRGWADDLYIDAVAESGSARLLPSTDLAAAVESGIIDGIDSYVEGGVQLNEIKIPFRYDGGLLDFSDLRANGPSIGLTLEGQVETRLSQLNVNGVLVPAYSINSLIGRIPLVGGLLTGGRGEGLFAFAYRVQGGFDNPNVTVSRLSGLAPGFLRGLFEGAKGKIENIEPAEGPPKEATGAR